MNRGRSQFTSGGTRRQGTEVHADRRTRRRRTRADDERQDVNVDFDDDLTYWQKWAEAQDWYEEPLWAEEPPLPRRRRRT